METYEQAVQRLYDLQKFGIKLGLNSTERLLARLGDPHLKLPTVHLAGTNGKGSVGAMLEATLRQAGLKTGFYTSPHLVRFTERFKIDGQEIAENEVAALADDVWRVVDPSQPPTFFEIVTAMAFLHFARRGVDVLILETGLGGRLDATNVCRPLASLITNIGLEHQDFLGKTLASIAFEKAGVIKPATPLIHGVSQKPARAVIEARAREMAAPEIRLGREITCRRRADESFALRGRLWRLDDLRCNLRGRHQPLNAALALGATEVLAEKGLAVGPEHFAAGLRRVDWPGRLERWPTDEGEPALWLDGAHNIPSAKALLASIDLLRRPGGPLVMVVGVMADKAVDKILAIVLPAADRVVFSRPGYSRAATPQALAAAAPKDCPPSEINDDLASAIQRARELAGPEGVVLITGSLFTVGEARAILGGMPTSDLP
ncbi:bifunctional folylpolyglutamate synthase/dihydrofolate synthase [Desulfarculus baarsii]